MADEKKKSVFETLSAVDVSKHVEVISMRKGPALKYVSWAWAWNMVKSIYPSANRVIEEFPEYRFNEKTGAWYATGQMLDYRITPEGCEVKVTVTIEDETYSERLYVMDMRNQPVAKPNIAQINKTQQRCLVKALAMAGLGLNLYAGEDLPMADINEADKEQAEQRKEQVNQQRKMNALQAEYRRLMMELINRLNGDAKRAEELVKGTLGEGKHNGQEYVNAVKALLESEEQK
ncbi:DUF1071 domain-containing protein (plasmid) [Limosilactobacillus mucosae]|uniref:Sak single strand annealing protein n=1 Tax=Limosilactobacillus mucosae TaxID=97478 RepID=UPI0015D5609C|nr:DUF1071 domain-containing protein [Limosilactobacillus mucosae]QLI94514.1 DUF1071 domain-containing protein [Limosilactobacillus mucosae]QLI95483.1 DUF1071 domain-containing protein [Limosilactobacillus mucosae]